MIFKKTATYIIFKHFIKLGTSKYLSTKELRLQIYTNIWDLVHFF